MAVTIITIVLVIFSDFAGLLFKTLLNSQEENLSMDNASLIFFLAAATKSLQTTTNGLFFHQV